MKAATRHSLVASALGASAAIQTKSASLNDTQSGVIGGLLTPEDGQTKKASLAKTIAAGHLAQEAVTDSEEA